MRPRATLLAVSMVLLLPIGASAATTAPSGLPTELWEQFPLDPAAQPAASPSVVVPPAAVTPPPTPSASPKVDTGAGPDIRVLLLSLLGALAGLIAVIFAARHVRLRRSDGIRKPLEERASPAVTTETCEAQVEPVVVVARDQEPPEAVEPTVPQSPPVAPPLPRPSRASGRRPDGDAGLAARVVGELRRGLDAGELSLLGEAWSFRYGAGTGADAWSGVIDRRLDDDARAALLAAGCRPGDAVLLLPPGEEERSPWRDHPEVLVPTALPDGLLFGYVDPHRIANMVAPQPDGVPGAVLAYLERWRPLLERRSERSRAAQAPWWEPSRRPVEAILAAPKLIIARRARSGRVAIDHDGGIYADNRSVLALPRSSSTRLDWGCALMASETAGLWLDGSDNIARASSEARLRDVGRLAGLPQPTDPIDANVSDLVAELAANRRALSLFVDTSPGLRDVLPDAWHRSPPGTDVQRVIDTLAVAERVSLDESELVGVHGDPDPERALFAVAQSDGSLALRDGRRIVGRISGDARAIELTALLLQRPRRLSEIRLPRDLDGLRQRIERRAEMMDRLLHDGLELAEAIEREVARSLGLSEDLIEEIIDRARRGAARPAAEPVATDSASADQSEFASRQKA